MRQDIYLQILERITNITTLLLNKDESFDFEGISINEISELLDLPVEVVRRDLAELFYLAKQEKAGFSLDSPDDDEIVNELLDLYSDKREKKIYTGNFDGKKFSASLVGYEKYVYCMLNNKEYSFLTKFLKKYNFNQDILALDDEEFYKVCPEYNDYSVSDLDVATKVLEAIRMGNDIRITYYNPNSDTNQIKIIKPLRVARYNTFGINYIITIEEGRLTSYRSDCIRQIRIEKKSTVVIDDLSPLDSLPYIWGMDTVGEEIVTFKVYNDNYGNVIDKVKRDLKSYIDNAGYTVNEVEDGIIVKGKVIGINNFKSWVRGYGASIVVLEPRKVALDIIENTKLKLKMYTK